MKTRTLPTADLTTAELGSIRALMDTAFRGGFDDHDWDHALGGSHVLIGGPDAVIAHASVVQRRFLIGDRILRCGYVEAVAVSPEHRGRGLAAAVMTEAERIVDGGFHLGALSASESARGLYLARGWVPWPGPTAVLSPEGVVRTPDDDGSSLVRTPAGFDLTGTLVCDWRDGDVW